MRILRNTATAAIAALLVLPANAALASEPEEPEEPTIETIAGGVPSGLEATSVSVKPVGMDYDAAGNLYIADPGQGVIWRMAPDGTIHHVAGTGRLCLPDPAECRAEGQPGTRAVLQAPAGLAVDSVGNIYVSEMRGHIVRRIDAQTGVITTFAGNGETGYSEDHDGGPATQASLWFPQSLDVDSQDNLYIADAGNNRIRKVTPSGTISTVAGCGDQQFPGCFYFAQDGSPVESTPIGANALINGNGWGIAIDANDDLYIADAAQIIKLDRSNDTYRVIAGKSFQYAVIPGEGENGPAKDARFSVIVEMDFAPNGDLYVMDGGGSYSSPVNRIQKLVAPVGPDSIVRHVGGLGTGNGYTGDGGQGRQARFAFSQPTGTWTGQGMAAAPDNDVLVGDVKNNRLRRIDADSGVVDTVAGNGFGGADYRYGLNENQPYDPFSTGMFSRGGVSGDGRNAATGQLYEPIDVEADRFGNVYVLDGGSHRVRRISADGTIVTVAGSGCVGEDCWGVRRGAPLGDGGPATQAQLTEPTAIALDRTGTQLYIVDNDHARVRQANLGNKPFVAYPLGTTPITIAPGSIQTVFGPGRSVATQGAPWGPAYQGCGLVKPYCGEGLHATEYSPSDPRGVATDGQGNLYVSDTYVGNVVKIDAATGVVTTLVGQNHHSDCSGGADDGPGRTVRLCGPSGLEVGDGKLFIAEASFPAFAESLQGLATGYPSASRVRVVDLSDPLAQTSTLAGSGAEGYDGDGKPGAEATLAHPHDVALGPDGSVYIADTGNSRIRRIAPDGAISTVVGQGTYADVGAFDGCSFAGDGKPLADALLCGPVGVDVAPNGTIYIADTINNRVRAIRGL